MSQYDTWYRSEEISPSMYLFGPSYFVTKPKLCWGWYDPYFACLFGICGIWQFSHRKLPNWKIARVIYWLGNFGYGKNWTTSNLPYMAIFWLDNFLWENCHITIIICHSIHWLLNPFLEYIALGLFGLLLGW